MSSVNKKTPVTNVRKKVTASARAKTSVRKPRTKTTAHNGSYLQHPVSTEEIIAKDTGMSSTVPKDTNDAILTLLQEMSKANEGIVHRIDVLKHQQSLNSTPLIGKQQSRVHIDPNPAPAMAALLAPQVSRSTNENYTLGQNSIIGRVYHMVADNNQEIPHPLLPYSMRTGEQNLHHDSVVPSLESLHQNSTLSQAVSRIMATYDGHARMEVVKIQQSPPETRWANEEFHSGQGKKRVVYDDLSLTQWAVGQLSNVYQMKDTVVSKQALLQVILALKDATSLPWQAVRSAWATSMHKIQDGSLTWADATQWLLNRLSALQIAMTNASIASNNVSQLHQRKTCNFFYEGACSHDSHHGNDKHFCAFCSRPGRYLVHSEVKCHFKVKSLEKNDKIGRETITCGQLACD